MATTKIRSSNQLFIDTALDMGMTGSNLKIINLKNPENPNDAVNKSYVDALQMGLDVKESVKVATTTNLSGTTNPAFTTLTNAFYPRAPIVIDGITGLTVGSRVLVKDQIDKSQNGIYNITNTGSSTTDWVLTRSSDFDNTPGVEVTAGAFTFVEEGVTNEDSGWVLTTNGTITIGVTPLTFVQFSGAGQIEAGWGMVKSGNTLSVNQTTMDDRYVNVSGDTMTGKLSLIYADTVGDSMYIQSYSTGYAVNMSLDGGNGIRVKNNTGDFLSCYNGSLERVAHVGVDGALDGKSLTIHAFDDPTYTTVAKIDNAGNISGTTFVKSGGLGDQYLMGDGTVTTTGNTVAMFDGRYVNVTGDTMTGSLNITGVSQLIEYSYVGINVVTGGTGGTIVNSIGFFPTSVEVNSTLQTLNIDVYSQNNNYNTLLSTNNVDGNFTITPFDNAQLVVIGTGGIKTNQLYVGTSGAEFSVFENGSFQSESSGTMNSLNIVNGDIVATISPSGIVNGVSFVKSGGTSTEYLMANGNVSERKYRLTPSISTGTTVVFSYTGIRSGNITIDETSFEFFKNGILMNEGSGNDYTSVVVNTVSKTITVTVTETILSGTYADIFLGNFTYTY